MRSLLAIVNVLGALLLLFAAYYLLPIITALVYGEAEELWVYLRCAGIRPKPSKPWCTAPRTARG